MPSLAQFIQKINYRVTILAQISAVQESTMEVN